MTTAQFELLEASEAEDFLRTRFVTLTRHGFPPGSALIIASHPTVDLDAAVELLRNGCPPRLVVPILG